MAVPRIRYAFGYFGDLRLANFIMFLFLLIVSGYFTNKYFGMNIHLRVLQRNTGNLSQSLVDEKLKNDVTVSEKGSLLIGSIGTMYLIISIYGIVAVIANEIYLLIPPMVLFPFAAFIMIVLIFFDLGIQERSGFLFFWVLTGFVFKILIAAASIYSFIVAFSYYTEVTRGPLEEEEIEASSSSRWFPSSKISSANRKTPPRPKTPPSAIFPPQIFPPKISPPRSPPPRPPSPRSPPPRPPPPRTPPPRPPPPKIRSPKASPPKVKSPQKK